MEKNIINPWAWQDNLGYAQAIEVKNSDRTLYCSGQAAMNADGTPAEGDMAGQVKLTLQNLEQVIANAGYLLSGITRFNIYTTSIADFFAVYGDVIGWMKQNNVLACSTLLEVKALAYPQLLVEIEATVIG